MEKQETKKKSYQTPELTVYGTVAEITQAFGSSSASDLIVLGSISFSLPGVTGSVDGKVVPLYP